MRPAAKQRPISCMAGCLGGQTRGLQGYGCMHMPCATQCNLCAMLSHHLLGMLLVMSSPITIHIQPITHPHTCKIGSVNAHVQCHCRQCTPAHSDTDMPAYSLHTTLPAVVLWRRRVRSCSEHACGDGSPTARSHCALHRMPTEHPSTSCRQAAWD